MAKAKKKKMHVKGLRRNVGTRHSVERRTDLYLGSIDGQRWEVSSTNIPVIMSDISQSYHGGSARPSDPL